MTAVEQPIEIRLSRGAAISGRVIDELGDPVVAAQVVAEAAASTTTGFTVAASTETDDRGEYRLGSLQAGTFAVAVLTRGAMTVQVAARIKYRRAPTLGRPTTPAAARRVKPRHCVVNPETTDQRPTSSSRPAKPEGNSR